MNNIPLHKTTHWRRFRNILDDICRLEKVDLSNYNTEKITCYRTVGIELQGTNVSFVQNGRKLLLGFRQSL